MPEGPEIRRAADRIAQVLVGKPLEDVRLHIPRLRQFESSLTGRSVTAVETRGKAMLTRFDNRLTLYSHNQLYGRWYTTRCNTLPETSRQLRVELHTGTRSALLYSATDIDILQDDQLETHPFLARLGPDCLDPGVSPGDIAARMQADRFCRKSFASLYLDQAFIAGLGNYLRSEILFLGGIHPLRIPADLADRETDALARQTLRVCKRSYRTGGVTVVPGLAARLKAEGERYAKRRFYVYSRNGQPCRQCGTRVEKSVLRSRNVFICPNCQPRHGSE